MRPINRWRAALAGLLLLADCSGGGPPPERTQAAAFATAPAAGSDPACQAGPDGGPLQADRGIGGTGAPSLRLADRGIGGTGIIGVITGFASVCVGGREVAYDPAVPVAIDDRAAAAAALRTGQVAAVEAFGPETRLQAGRVAIRHEVIGPVEALEAPGILRVAGQRVAVEASTLGDTVLQPGQWVAVSGFRDPDGVIHATRLDRRTPGDVLLRGLLLHEGPTWRVGTLQVRFSPALRPVAQRLVVLEGHYAEGVLDADSLSPDFWDPAVPGVPVFFGPDIQVVVVETFAGYSDGRLVIGRRRTDRGSSEIERSVIEFERHPNGSLQPFRSRVLAPAGMSPGAAATPGGGPLGRPAGPRFEPAPVPARGLDANRGRTGGMQGGEPGRSIDRPGSRGVAGERAGTSDVEPQAAPSGASAGGLPGNFPGGLPGGLPGRGR